MTPPEQRPASSPTREHLRRRARTVATQLRQVDFRGLDVDEAAAGLVRIEQRLDALAAPVRGTAS